MDFLFNQSSRKLKIKTSQNQKRGFVFSLVLFRSIALALRILCFKPCRETAKFGGFFRLRRKGK